MLTTPAVVVRKMLDAVAGSARSVSIWEHVSFFSNGEDGRSGGLARFEIAMRQSCIL
jgi:hypothetical protein